MQSLSISKNIDISGVFQTFSLLGLVNQGLHQIEKATKELKLIRDNIHKLKPEQAKKELKKMERVMPLISHIKENLKILDNSGYEVKKIVLDFVHVFESVFERLDDLADIHSSYRASAQVLAKEWDNEKDAHWEKY